jgi:hypothetical protein
MKDFLKFLLVCFTFFLFIPFLIAYFNIRIGSFYFPIIILILAVYQYLKSRKKSQVETGYNKSHTGSSLIMAFGLIILAYGLFTYISSIGDRSPQYFIDFDRVAKILIITGGSIAIAGYIAYLLDKRK